MTKDFMKTWICRYKMLNKHHRINTKKPNQKCIVVGLLETKDHKSILKTEKKKSIGRGCRKITIHSFLIYKHIISLHLLKSLIYLMNILQLCFHQFYVQVYELLSMIFKNLSICNFGADIWKYNFMYVTNIFHNFTKSIHCTTLQILSNVLYSHITH